MRKIVEWPWFEGKRWGKAWTTPISNRLRILLSTRIPSNSTNHASKIERFLRLLQKGSASAFHPPSPTINLPSPPRAALVPSRTIEGIDCYIPCPVPHSDCSRPRSSVMTAVYLPFPPSCSSAPTSAKVSQVSSSERLTPVRRRAASFRCQALAARSLPSCPIM